MFEKVNETVEFLQKIIKDFKPELGIILGTGLGHLVSCIEIEHEIEYENIPNFPLSTVESHKGKLIFGVFGKKKIVAMQGRFHYYEGYTLQEIVFPVRVMKFLGIDKLVISNACGSVNPYIKKSSLMLIDDHINLLGDNPLIGKHDNRFGERFTDMSRPYSPRFIELAETIALELGIKLYKGVYAVMSGPSLETRAEYRMLQIIGADTIGMSTVPETIAARQMGIEVLGVSVITDECYPDSLKKVDINEIIEAAAAAEPDLARLIFEFASRL